MKHVSGKCSNYNHPGLTKITNLSYDRTFQLLWTTCHGILRVQFSGTMMLVPASLAVPSLTLVCVCVKLCMWVHVFHRCESSKFKRVAVVVLFSVTVLYLKSVSVLLCNEVLGTSSSLNEKLFKLAFSWLS